MHKTAASLLLVVLLLAADYGLFALYHVRYVTGSRVSVVAKPAVHPVSVSGSESAPAGQQAEPQSVPSSMVPDDLDEEVASVDSDDIPAASAAAPGEEAGPLSMASKALRNPAPEEKQEKKLWSTDKDGISKAFRQSLPEVRECYEAWLTAEPDRHLAGEIEVEFTIEPDVQQPASGKVTNIAIAGSDMDHRPLEACVISIVANLSFAAPPEPKTVKMPLFFSEQ